MKKVVLFLSAVSIASLAAAAENLAYIKAKYESQKDEVFTICRKIEKPINDIMVLSGVSTISSGVGTVAAGTATVAGVVKWDKDRLISELEAIEKMTDKEFLNYLAWLGDQAEQESRITKEEQSAKEQSFKNQQNALTAKIAAEQKASQTLGNVRTLGSFVAGGTSAISAGTSFGALAVDFDALKKNMEDCEVAASKLYITRNEILAEDMNDPVAKEIDDVIATCRGFNKKNVDTIKTTLTLAGVISVVGTGTGIAGGITSYEAVSKERKAMDAYNNKSTDTQSIAMIAGKNGTKDLNVASNILSGVTTATSLSSGLLTGLPLINLNRNSEILNDCLEKLK